MMVLPGLGVIPMGFRHPALMSVSEMKRLM
jgi:hypothetical protein